MAQNITVNVTATATRLFLAEGPNQYTVLVDNSGTGTITIGGPGVVAGAGPQLAQSTTPVPFTVEQDSIYAICAGGQTATVEIAVWISGSGR